MMRCHFRKEREDYNSEYLDRVKAHFKNCRVETDHEYDLFIMNGNSKKPEGKRWNGHGLEAQMINHSGGRKQKRKPNKGKDEHSSRYGHSDSYDPIGEDWERIKAESQRGKNFRQQ